MANDPDFIAAIESDDVRRQLVALRDLVAHELDVTRCDKCTALKLRTGDTAALVLRLQTIIREIEAMPEKEEASRLDKIRAARGNVVELRPGSAS